MLPISAFGGRGLSDTTQGVSFRRRKLPVSAHRRHVLLEPRAKEKRKSLKFWRLTSRSVAWVFLSVLIRGVPAPRARNRKQKTKGRGTGFCRLTFKFVALFLTFPPNPKQSSAALHSPGSALDRPPFSSLPTALTSRMYHPPISGVDGVGVWLVCLAVDAEGEVGVLQVRFQGLASSFAPSGASPDPAEALSDSLLRSRDLGFECAGFSAFTGLFLESGVEFVGTV